VFKHMMKEIIEQSMICVLSFIKITHGTNVKKDAHHGSHSVDPVSDIFRIQNFSYFKIQDLCRFVQTVKKLGIVFNNFQSFESGFPGQLISAERTFPFNPTFWGERIPKFVSSCKSSHGHSTTHDFTIPYQIGFHIVAFLSPSKSEPKAGHHLIKNQ